MSVYKVMETHVTVPIHWLFLYEVKAAIRHLGKPTIVFSWKAALHTVP